MRRRHLTVPIALAALVALLPASAAAQVDAPGDDQDPQGAPAPEPQPKPGKASIRVKRGVATKHVRWYMRGQKVVVVGTVRPFVPGQRMTLHAIRGKRAVARFRVPIRRARGGRGRFVVQWVPKRVGQLRLVARHRATPRQAAFRAGGARVGIVRWSAGPGSDGLKVLLLQRGLLKLGFATPVSGYYDAATSRGVLAFRKTNGMGRNGFASRAVYAKVMRGRGAFKVRHRGAGRHVEFDWSRQVLVLAKGRKPYRVYHASSGKASTPTVFGSFRFYRKDAGTNSVGMVHSNYFIGGYAIHGYPSVPNYPASHGCIRVPIPNAWAIYKWTPVGMPIFVYR